VDNKKLTSNKINDIFIRDNGTIWIATDDGMLTGSGDKWTLMERYLNFVGVDAFGSNMWILGDDFLWQVDTRGKWTPIAIELKNVEGKLRDIAVDDEGRVWIASNMMTGFDVDANRYQRFGPGQYFTSQYVNCLDVDQDGSIWTGTDDKGLYLLQWEVSMVVLIEMDTPPNCKSDAPTASLSVKISGGEAPYTYKWSSGQTTDKIAQVEPGDYVLTVTDAKGLVKTGKYSIPDPGMKISIEVIKPSSGSAEGDANVNLLVNGGTGAMTYKWDNGETNQLATKLTAGNHAVTVTDETGCSATTSFTVPEKVGALSVTLSAIAENKCADARSGLIEATVNGGKPPIKYQWSQGSTAEGRITELGAGDYAVTVADAAGQTASAFIKLTAPPAIVITLENVVPANLGVENGQAMVKVTGGKPPYLYKWDNGVTTASVKTLSSGEHSVTVTDANGCATVLPVSITENIATLGVIIKQVGTINCNGQKTGSLQTDIKGGKPPFTYSWSNGATSAMAENLAAGVHSVTVTDAAGTKFTASSSVPEPTVVVATATLDAASSANNSDGKATVRASGGTGLHTYLWDNGETTNKAIKLSAGTHTVTVTDAAGCSSTASVEVNENIQELHVAIETTSLVKCAGTSEGSVKAIVKGGKEPYTYKWNVEGTTNTQLNLPDGVYTLTVTDAANQSGTFVVSVFSPEPLVVTTKADAAASTNQKDGKASVTVTGGTGKYTYNWDSGEKTAKAVALGAGTHTLTVTDENGCTATGSIIITENILPLAATIKQVDKLLCPDQTTASLTATITGGKAPYIYTWKGHGKDLGGNETISQLASGEYVLEVTDAAGNVTGSTFIVAAPSPIVLTGKVESPATTNKQDAKASVTASGGSGKYTYAWDSGEKAAKALALGAGTHSVTVTDENGCTATTSVVITENILPLAASIKQTAKILCADQPAASLTADITGGKAPYTIRWKGPAKEWTGDESISQLEAGTYALQVVDVNGSSVTSSFEVTSPKPLTVTASEITPANTGAADGSVVLKASGGTGNYSIESGVWPAGSSQHKIEKLKPGTYTYIVKDASGCTASTEVKITEDILPLTVSIKQTTDLLCAGTSVASLEAVVKGGKPPYTYNWSNAATTANASNLGEGNYTLNITDATGQKATATFTVKEPEALKAEPVNLRSATNDRISDGKGAVEIKGGKAPFTYKWNSGEVTAQATKLPLGRGNVIITDANGCTTTAEFIIKEKVLPELTASRLASGEPIRMEKIQFDADSTVIKPEAVPSLDELYEFLYDNPTTIIEVSGHTNSLPADDYCDRISSERAKSVADYLVNKGIESRRVISIGHGKRKPIATNQTPEGRKKNQRVEIRLIKIEE
jgi:outer membrane protein OmpA-like peptidoglycan-associated protein